MFGAFHQSARVVYTGEFKWYRYEAKEQAAKNSLVCELKEKLMPETPKVKGPASYFPSIEKTYGKPISHWMEILKKAGQIKHMELVAMLKSDHKMGHGHANALVAHFLASK